MKQKINRNWQFRRTDDSNTQWRQLDLPHDWAIEGDFSASNYIHSIQVEKHLEFRHDSYLPRGCGEYQKHLSLPEKFPGQQLILEFDGVFGERIFMLNVPLCSWFPALHTSIVISTVAEVELISGVVMETPHGVM